MSDCSPTQATSFCSLQGWRSCMIMLWFCGSMLTSLAFRPENILLGFDSAILSGPNIPSGCFDFLTLYTDDYQTERPVLAPVITSVLPTIRWADHSGSFWQKRYYDRNVREAAEFDEKLGIHPSQSSEEGPGKRARRVGMDQLSPLLSARSRDG